MTILCTVFGTTAFILLISALINGPDGDEDDFSEIITLVLAGIAIASLFAMAIVGIYKF